MLKGMLNAAANKAALPVIKTLANKKIEGYGQILDLRMENREIHTTVALDGLEDREITAVCRSVFVSSDGDEVTLSDFTSNMPLLEKALNTFAAKTYNVEDSNARLLLSSLRGLFGGTA